MGALVMVVKGKQAGPLVETERTTGDNGTATAWPRSH